MLFVYLFRHSTFYVFSWVVRLATLYDVGDCHCFFFFLRCSSPNFIIVDLWESMFFKGMFSGNAVFPRRQVEPLPASAFMV